MVNILSVGTPVDSTQVQEIKSIKGMPVGWPSMGVAYHLQFQVEKSSS